MDVKNVFYDFLNAFFKSFYLLNVFYFLVAIFFIALNLLNSCIKRFVSDGLNMAV